MAAHPRPMLGELMVEHGLISRAELKEALQRQRGTFQYVGHILVHMGAITRADLRRMLEVQHMLGRGYGSSVLAGMMGPPAPPNNGIPRP